jgi:hypothetical protein
VAVATADAEGAYVLPRLRPGEYRLRATRLELHESALPQDAVEPGRIGVDFTLAKNPSVIGSVVDQGGRVVPRFSLTFTPTQKRPTVRGAKPPPAGLAPRTVEIVDDGGIFKVEDLLPGSYLVDVSAPGYAPTRGAEFEIASFADHDLGQLTIRSGGILRGTVTDERGTPVPNADVILTRIGGGAAPALPPQKTSSGAADATVSGRTDASGAFFVDAAPQGQYLLRIDSSRHVLSSPIQLNLMDGAEERQDVVVRRAGAATLLVRDDAGDVVANCIVEILDSDGRHVTTGSGAERTARTNGEGRVVLPRIPLGMVTVRLKRLGWNFPDTPITVVEGEQRTHTLTMARVRGG